MNGNKCCLEEETKEQLCAHCGGKISENKVLPNKNINYFFVIAALLISFILMVVLFQRFLTKLLFMEQYYIAIDRWKSGYILASYLGFTDIAISAIGSIVAFIIIVFFLKNIILKTESCKVVTIILRIVLTMILLYILTIEIIMIVSVNSKVSAKTAPAIILDAFVLLMSLLSCFVCFYKKGKISS
jgi:hypothetical protein